MLVRLEQNAGEFYLTGLYCAVLAPDRQLRNRRSTAPISDLSSLKSISEDLRPHAYHLFS